MSLLVRVPRQRTARSDYLLKLTVCAKYSGKGRAECSVPSCRIRHLDMLQIDHKSNDAKWRKVGKGAGIPFYRKLRRMGYPPGFQTLCANHHALKTKRSYR